MSTFKTEDGVSITYNVNGTGAPLVMIHGINGNQSMFNDIMEQMKPHFQVITYDVRGHGLSDKPSDYTIDDQVNDLDQLLGHLEINQAHVLGFSMGAYIALGFAVDHSDKLDKLILVGGKAHTKVSSFARLMMQHRQEIRGMTKEEMQWVLSKYIYHQLDLIKPWLSEVDAYHEMTEEEEAVASRSIAGFDYRDRISEIKNDVLLIVGLHDQLNPKEESFKIAEKLQKSSLYVYESSGHAPFIEEAERFRSDIIQFIG